MDTSTTPSAPAQPRHSWPRLHLIYFLLAGFDFIAILFGPGISEENRKNILEPLFTTKNFGVGLGLPAVEKILEQHGGGLEIASKLGEGASFTAWFPLDQARAEAA